VKITVLAVGKKMPDWVNDGFNEYARRISGDCKLQLVEVSAVKRSRSNTTNTIKAREAVLIRQKIPNGNRIIALDEKGKSCSTKALLQKLMACMVDGQDICLIVGGTDGLDASIIDDANEVMSLSEMTLPHGLARIILAEQLYRAWSIMKKHPYHRE